MKNEEETTSKQSTPDEVDYVIVIEAKKLENNDNVKLAHNFLNALHIKGVEITMDYGILYSNYLFIRLTIPDQLVQELCSSYNISLSYINPYYSSETQFNWRLFQTEIDLKEYSRIFRRAPDILIDVKPTKPTKAEKSMLLYLLMAKTWFDVNANDYGVDKLLSKGVFAAAYPIHDGAYYWTQNGPLSERQLLVKYWACFTYFYKNQPLNLIEKYFGSKVAIYFAFMDFYTKWLAAAAVVGVIFYFAGFLMAAFVNVDVIEEEICKSNITLCPICSNNVTCQREMYNNYCDDMKRGVIFDSMFSSIYGALMSVWAIFLMLFWKRRLNMLRMRWNVVHIRLQKELRPEYVEIAKHIRINTAAGEAEHYVPIYKRIFHLSFTNGCIVMLGFVLILFGISMIVVGNRLSYYIMYSVDEKTVIQATLFSKILSGALLFIQLYGFITYLPVVAAFFAKLEVPSSQQSYDNSYILKHSILLFANRYTALIYLTFIRGRAYGHPGKNEDYYMLKEFAHDLCGPLGCFFNLGVALGTVFGIDSASLLLVQFFYMFVQVKINKRKHTKDLPNFPQWELDFGLLPSVKLSTYINIFDIISQYALIVAFVPAFPLGPLFALMRNIFKIRLEAIRFAKYNRKCIPMKDSGLGPYNKIIKWACGIAIFVNGCVIAFSSSTVTWLLYKFYFETENGGYYKFILSEFDSSDLSEKTARSKGICYYPGLRYPPNNPHKYEPKIEFYIIFIAQLIFVIIYEQIMLFISGLLRSTLTEQPRIYKERTLHEEVYIRDVRQKILNDLYNDPVRQYFPDLIKIPTPYI